MVTFLFKRLLSALPTLGLLVAATFFLLRLAPGGPFDTDHVWPPEIQENILRRYGLDQPLVVQFGSWLKDLARGDLRESFQYIGKPVTEMLAESFPVSLLLGTIAFALAVVIGLPLGAIAAWKRGSFWDTSAMFLAVSGISLPSYLLASVLILVFSFWLGWFPPALWESPTSIVLPVLTLAARPMAVLARLMRASMIEALQSDYVRTALGKGVRESQVVFKHALKNSLIPVITVMGPLGANLVTGSFLVEIVFQIPGMGKYFVQGVLNRDYPLVMGVTLVYGVVLVFSNLLVDLVYGLIDPRVKVG